MQPPQDLNQGYFYQWTSKLIQEESVRLAIFLDAIDRCQSSPFYHFTTTRKIKNGQSKNDRNKSGNVNRGS